MKKESKQNLFYTLNTNTLKKGDIILTAEKGKISLLIKAVTFGTFSHAMIYLGGSSYSEAASPTERVTSQNTQRLFFENTKQCCVLRLKESVSTDQMNLVVDSARQMIGMEYSLEEVKLVPLRKKLEAKEVNRQFCSRYVAQAYGKAKFDIVNNVDYCSPTDIYKSNLLIKVENHLKLVTEEEKKKFEKMSNSMLAKDQADNFRFSKAKEITGIDIQTDEQFDAALLQNPKYDEEFAEILNESKYLKIWEIEKNENPWLYDFDLLVDEIIDIDQIKEMGEKQLPEEYELRRRLIANLRYLEESYKNNKLKTLNLQIELYGTLLELSEIREGVWRSCKEIK